MKEKNKKGKPMKKGKLLFFLALIAIAVSICACDLIQSPNSYTISLNADMPLEVEVGDEIDFKEYFVVKDSDGNDVPVTDDMLDLSAVDTSVPGFFSVTLKVGSASYTLKITVFPKQGSDTPSDPNPPDVLVPAELSAVFAQYADMADWNFAIAYKETDGTDTYEEQYEYLAYWVKNTYSDEYGTKYTDYYDYDPTTELYYVYADNGDGTYTLYDEAEYDLSEFLYYLMIPDLTALQSSDFSGSDGEYSAVDADAVGNAVLGIYEGYEWVRFDLSVSEGKISKIVAVMDDGYTQEYVFSKCGAVSFTLPTEVVLPDEPDDPVVNPEGLEGVIERYADVESWNFAITLTAEFTGYEAYEDYYEYDGYNVKNTYTDDYGFEYTDYWGYDAGSGSYSFYADSGDGTYDVYAEGTADYEECLSYLSTVDLSLLGEYSFTLSGGKYVADDPAEAGNAILGDYIDFDWTKVELTVSGSRLISLVGTADDGSVMTFVLSNEGKVSFTLPNGTEPDDPVVTPSGTMEDQVYDASHFDDERLQDKIPQVEGGESIGLPSTGNFHALVIPVQFSGDTITQTQLDRLEKAFNGTASDTGWESVKSYYEKSSYGKLVLNFDIQSVYKAKYNADYYESYKKNNYTYGGQQYTTTGDEIILQEVLSYYEKTMDLSQYDTNGDEIIDAVYLIYSAPVDYSEDSFYWAYVTWYYGEETYDNVGAYYYLFASFGFMDESTSRDKGSGYNKINGLDINAATYIHETGHLFGLDDYYDYYEGTGSDEGLGGSDMMDYTIGDQNVYSKTMLGWLTPTVVNSTQTVTLQSSQEKGDAILIPLDFDNSYFCEYLLIDLYTADGLNELHSKNAVTEDLILYGGAQYGVRIYHVSSSIDDPYSDSYGSFTDNNNSVSKNALIKLVEADGESKFRSSGGYAAESDLWQQGDKLSDVFPSYTRNDGMKVNFDVTVNSVSKTSASITVTFL